MEIITERRMAAGMPVLEFFGPQEPGRLPLIFLMHGFTGRKEDNLAGGEYLARQGFCAVSLDLHLHGELSERVRRDYTDPGKIALIEYEATGHETRPEMFERAGEWLRKYL